MRHLSTLSLLALCACGTLAPVADGDRSAVVSRGAGGLSLDASAAVVGGEMVLWAGGAASGDVLTFAIGDSVGVGGCPAPLGGLCTDLVGGRVLGTAIADADGVATFRMAVPAGALLGDVRAFQAFLEAGVDSATSDPMTRTVSEAQRFELVFENVSPDYRCVSSGTFSVVEQLGVPNAALSGQSYRFEVDAAPGDALSVATMFVQSNDLFVAPDELGIELYDVNGDPVVGEVGDQLALWDAGTEVDQEPGVGADQAPRQLGPDQGADDPDDTVRLADDAFGTLPAASDVVSIDLSYLGDHRFEVVLSNVSTPGGLVTSGSPVDMPISPGGWCVHRTDAPLFTVGAPLEVPGLEGMAEDGSFGAIGDDLAAETGANTPLTPVLWAVHRADDVLFTEGELDRGLGLEALSEDGSPGSLSAAIADAFGVVSSGVLDLPDGAAVPGPLLSGDRYVAEIEASEGDRLSLATMYVMSNDFFLAPDGAGIALFDGSGVAVSGDLSDQVLTWDAGTEVDQFLGTGTHQAPFQAGPNTGADQGGPVITVASPVSMEHLRVTVTPL